MGDRPDNRGAHDQRRAPGEDPLAPAVVERSRPGPAEKKAGKGEIAEKDRPDRSCEPRKADHDYHEMAELQRQRAADSDTHGARQPELGLIKLARRVDICNSIDPGRAAGLSLFHASPL